MLIFIVLFDMKTRRHREKREKTISNGLKKQNRRTH